MGLIYMSKVADIRNVITCLLTYRSGPKISQQIIKHLPYQIMK